MKDRRVKMLLPVLGSIIILLSGCAVDNKYIAKLPFFEMKSDSIPGLDSPHVRKKLIREKGIKGATASDEEREILVAQLVLEYQTSPDPNMRREAVDALAKIPHPQRDRFLQEILQDTNPFVRLSALESLSKTYSGDPGDLQTLLISQMKTDTDKDVRLAAVRILGDVSPRCTVKGQNPPQAVPELGNLLNDRVPAIRYEAMQSLRKITGLDYGNDINRWLQYIRYEKGEIPDLPAERTFTEKIPTIALPMFK
jgi:hypothetical protein